MGAKRNTGTGTRSIRLRGELHKWALQPTVGVGWAPICLSTGRSTGGKPSGQIKSSYEPPGARPSTGVGGGEPNGRQTKNLFRLLLL